MLGQVGQIHCAVLFTTLQPILYGARQPSVTHGSAKNVIRYLPLANSLSMSYKMIENSKLKYLEVLLLWVLGLALLK